MHTCYYSTMEPILINPRFSKSEIEKIDLLIHSGNGKNRADFVRTATLELIWKLERNENNMGANT